MEIQFEKFSFKKRLVSMIKVDFRRMFTMPIYYIVLGISFVVPILILVMTTLMVGMESQDPITGEITIMEPIFTNVWQSIGSMGGNSDAAAVMDLTTMCNINMMIMAVAVLVCIFISQDFRSGYSKNLFAMRSEKKEYVISKTLIGFITGATIMVAYFIGALIGGKISSLSFELTSDLSIYNIIMCMLSKILILLVFVPIFVVMSVVGKQRTWLSMITAFGASMLLFTMVPMITPLNATFMNVVLCLAGGILFSIGIGAISNIILKKTSLV